MRKIENILLHYDLLVEFHNQYFKDLITDEHLVGTQIHLPKLTYPDGDDEYANFWGYKFVKNGKQYLIKSDNSEGNEINLKELLPFRADGLQKVASKGQVYYLIHRPVSMSFKSVQTMTFKQLINKLSAFSHTNPTHQKLDWLMAFSMMSNRCNFRKSTPPAFGKDSTIDVFGNLIGQCATIESPTIAKLEYMSSIYKVVAVNEAVDIPKAQWTIIEQFLLSAGAFKPNVTKHSRGISGVQEVIDMQELSIGLFYNDIDCYQNQDKYFDFVAKKAVKDRFPSFRMYGVLNEDFNAIKKYNIKEYVKEHFEEYRELIYNYRYYSLNMQTLLNHWDSSNLTSDIPERWLTNIGILLRAIDIYSDDQEEFTQWIEVINKCMLDYKEMVRYKKNYDVIMEKLNSAIKDPQILREKVIDLNKALKTLHTFIDKNILLRHYKITNTLPIKEVNLEGFYNIK